MKLKCFKCLKKKDTSEFYKSTTRKRNFTYYCKACFYIKSKNYRILNKNKIKLRDSLYYAKMKNTKWFKDSRKNSKLKFRYGITLNEYVNLLRKQKYKCAICKEIKKLVVDHNHKTNKIRGLLCDLCNKGLGAFKDNTDSLNRAAKYLDKKSF